MLEELPAVYILLSRDSGNLHSGVAANLREHMCECREALGRNGCRTAVLVYFEICEHLEQAYLRERQVRQYSQRRKSQLVEHFNPMWKDLFLSQGQS